MFYVFEKLNFKEWDKANPMMDCKQEQSERITYQTEQTRPPRRSWFKYSNCSKNKKYAKKKNLIQLTLEQHGYELHESACTRTFFH